jgi:hypothetical protein
MFSFANIIYSSELATNEEAWQQTRDVHGIMPLSFPSDQMMWGTATTKDSTTWTTVNDHGVSVAMSVIAGYKFVVLATRKQKRTKSDPIGDLRTIRGFGRPETESWSPSADCHELWDHEGILLGPGDTL